VTTPPVDLTHILRVLPHKWPFLLVDRVTSVVPGEVVRGHKCVAMNEPWFLGHFPENPIMPGVLVIESFAQIGGVLAFVTEPFDLSTKLMVFLGVDRAKFRKPIVPGDRVDLEVRVLYRREGVWKMKGLATVDGVPVAEAEIMTGIVERAG
jgi:3-hydroxyacyl-[acyl-carrier-protein] dehydratase